ncbi:MAG: LamG domain-containing protein [Bacteroidetes bacterium]|nr:LamG domain-containing protein [Bacteroidota bacterium]
MATFDMRWFGIVCLLCLISFLVASAQTDNVGSGRAITFNGASDYIDFGDIYKDLKIPFTISAWVYFDPSSPSPGGPIFANRNCTPIYTGFRLFATPTSISVDCGDGFGGNSPVFRKGWLANVALPKGTWIHVTAVARTFFDMSLYVNGVDVGGETIGSSSFNMDSSKPGFASTAYFTSNNVIYRYKDMIDDIRLWNRALSEVEIRTTMCRNLSGTESGLVGYWNFNEISGGTVLDKSPNKFHGQFVGNPTRVYSGAPIGDLSVFNYPATTTSIVDGSLKVEASDISGAVQGIQLYEIKSKPSQTGGLDNAKANSPYFGVFLATIAGTGSYTAKGFVNDQPICDASFRTDNSKPTWTAAILPQNAQPLRGEYVLADGVIASFDLGPDKVVCDQPTFTLTTMLSDPTFTYLWNTGENTPSIIVTQSGVYSVKVTSPCGSVTDQARVDFYQKPVFDLGAAKIICDQPSFTISTQLNDPNLNYLWNTGQNTPYIVVSQSGNYSVTVASPCGIVTDNVQVDILRTPQPFSFGQDVQSCEPNSITLKPYKDPLGFNYKWQDGSTNDSYFVTDFGKYWVKVKNGCGEATDTITLTKLNLKIGFVPNVITPDGDEKNEFFQVDPIYSGIVRAIQRLAHHYTISFLFGFSFKNTSQDFDLLLVAPF